VALSWALRDKSDWDHPSTEGHRYLAERVAEAIDKITAPADVVADAPLESELVEP
jgi:hypothetical protein